MATVVKCDFCGAPIEQYDYESAITFRFNRRAFKLECCKSSSSSWVRLDMCDSCSAKFGAALAKSLQEVFNKGGD